MNIKLLYGLINFCMYNNKILPCPILACYACQINNYSAQNQILLTPLLSVLPIVASGKCRKYYLSIYFSCFLFLTKSMTHIWKKMAKLLFVRIFLEVNWKDWLITWRASISGPLQISLPMTFLPLELLGVCPWMSKACLGLGLALIPLRLQKDSSMY